MEQKLRDEIENPPERKTVGEKYKAFDVVFMDGFQKHQLVTYVAKRREYYKKELVDIGVCKTYGSYTVYMIFHKRQSSQ